MSMDSFERMWNEIASLKTRLLLAEGKLGECQIERDEAQRILRKQTPLADDAHVRFLMKQRIAVERELAETYALLNETRATMHAAHRALAGALSWASAGVAPPDGSAILRASEAVAASVDASNQRYAAHVARGSNDSGA
jgi:hypothetical protein